MLCNTFYEKRPNMIMLQRLSFKFTGIFIAAAEMVCLIIAASKHVFLSLCQYHNELMKYSNITPYKINRVVGIFAKLNNSLQEPLLPVQCIQCISGVKPCNDSIQFFSLFELRRRSE